MDEKKEEETKENENLIQKTENIGKTNGEQKEEKEEEKETRQNDKETDPESPLI